MSQGTPTFADNQMPAFSRVLDIKYGVGAGTTRLASAVFEDINLTYESAIVERKDEIGKENGWTLVATGKGTGTATIQIPTSAAVWPRNGDWISDAFDGSSTATETWVIHTPSKPFRFDSYYKVNVQLRLSNHPATA